MWTKWSGQAHVLVLQFVAFTCTLIMLSCCDMQHLHLTQIQRFIFSECLHIAFHQFYIASGNDMASYAESNASFKHRAQQIQLADDHIQAMYDNDIRCFNHLAFAVNGQPGQLDSDRFQSLVEMICPRGASIGVQAGLKQLAYEALTVAVAAIKQRVETPDDAIRKLPAQEKDMRLKTMRSKISGFEITGDYEPGHCVIDAFAGMLEEGALKHFPLSRCVSRELELLSVKTDKQVVLLEGQQLQVRAKTDELTSEIGNELRVHQAMVRRGLALEMSNLGTYAVHEKVMRYLMNHLNKPAPPGYKPASIDAILRADKELWTRVADQVRSDLRADRNGEMPVDVALQQLHTTASVVFHLLPLPAGGGANAGVKRKAPEDEPAAPKAQPKASPKKRPRNRQGRSNLPAGLHGYSGWNKQKQRICYNFNMAHGCTNKVTKENNFDKCNKGMHQCIKCHGKHPLKPMFKLN